MIQNNFTAGEFDPLVYGRYDLAQRKNAAESLQNCIPLPQGGCRRRDGLRFTQEQIKKLDRIVANVTISAAASGDDPGRLNDGDLATLFTTTAPLGAGDFMLARYDLGSPTLVLFADVVGLRNITNANAYADFFVQYSTDDMAWTDLGAAIKPGTVSGNTRRRTGPILARYWRIFRRMGSDYAGALLEIQEFNLWLETGDLSDSRVAAFEFSEAQRYALLFSDQNVRVFIDDVYQADIRSSLTDVALADGARFWLTQELDTLICGHPAVQPQRFQRQGADTEWHSETVSFVFLPKYAFVPVSTRPAGTLTPSAVSGNITVTASIAPPFTAAHVDQFVDGNFGRARLLELVSTTVMKAIVVIPFFDTSAIANNKWTLDTGYENVWSDARGWPQAGMFYQDRLVLGGSTQLPNGLGLSRIGRYFDFNQGQVLDDDGAFILVKDKKGVPTINHLTGERELIILTSLGEFYVPQAQGVPLTPRNISVRKSTAHGNKAGVPPVSVSGTTIFVQREGKAVREFVFTQQEDAFIAPSLSLLSSHLIRNPLDATVRRATSADDADLLFMVNNDGTAIVCLTMRDQNIGAWAPLLTDGSFLRCGAVGPNAYFIVERIIAGVARRFLERFDRTLFVDCGVSFGAGGPVFAVAHLEGKTVNVRADDSVLSDEIVVGGQITADRAAVSSAQIGLAFVPICKTLEPARETPGGAVRFDGRTRISRIMLDLFETQNLLVNGQRVTFRKFGEPLDTPPPTFTGRKVIDGVTGWEEGSHVTLTQDAPAPFTVKLIEYQVRE